MSLKCRGSLTAAGAALILLASAPRPALAQINIGGSNPLVHTENFDTLASGPLVTDFSFVDNVTLPGVYTTRTTYRASSGAEGTAVLYSYGASSGPNMGDRALGGISPSQNTDIVYGFRFVNTGSTPLTSFQVSYNGEFWRRGTTLTIPDVLEFGYQVFDAGTGSITDPDYTRVSELDFVVISSGPPGNNGNTPFSTTSINNGAGTSISVAPGQEIWIRWYDFNSTALTDHGLAVDDFSITFTTTAIPEPGTFILMAAGAVGSGALALGRRRGKKHTHRRKRTGA
jgi:PEP-CTERM putative exosortase interaction domain